MPGKPDLVLPKYRAVIFVHGCFWHKHDCHLFKWPKSRPDFWRKKILGNVANDEKALDELENKGWRVLIVWECAIKGKEKLKSDHLIDQVTGWLFSDDVYCEIRGKPKAHGGK